MHNPTVVEHWLKREIAQWVHPMKDRSDDPSHHDVLFSKIKFRTQDLFVRKIYKQTESAVICFYLYLVKTKGKCSILLNASIIYHLLFKFAFVEFAKCQN